MMSFSCRSALFLASHSSALALIFVRHLATASCRRINFRMRFSIVLALMASCRVSSLNELVLESVDERYSRCAASNVRSSASIVPSSAVLSALYSSAFEFFSSSRRLSNSVRHSCLCASCDASIASMRSIISRLCRACAPTISARSASNSSVSALRVVPYKRTSGWSSKA
eukprot:31011-Pelagococcus_subviridis.AAC.5